MEEKTKNYNPADYAAVEIKAKSMDKKELEDYYVKDKDKRYVPLVLAIIFGVFILGILFAMFMVGNATARDSVNEELNENIINLQEEICPLVGDYEFTIQEKRRFWNCNEIKLNCRE